MLRRVRDDIVRPCNFAEFFLFFQSLPPALPQPRPQPSVHTQTATSFFFVLFILSYRRRLALVDLFSVFGAWHSFSFRFSPFAYRFLHRQAARLRVFRRASAVVLDERFTNRKGCLEQRRAVGKNWEDKVDDGARDELDIEVWFSTLGCQLLHMHMQCAPI